MATLKFPLLNGFRSVDHVPVDIWPDGNKALEVRADVELLIDGELDPGSFI